MNAHFKHFSHKRADIIILCYSESKKLSNLEINNILNYLSLGRMLLYYYIMRLPV